MYNETMYERGNAPSAIRELFAYGMERKAQIGEDKVFDFSIGNPSVPAPDSVAETIRELADMAPAQLHAYSAAQGLESTRAAIAENLNKRFGTHYTADNLYLTMGAAACLSACFTALIKPGDEIIVIGVDCTDTAVEYINAGKLYGTVKQDGDAMGKANILMAINGALGKDWLDGTDYTMADDGFSIRIPYAKITAE